MGHSRTNDTRLEEMVAGNQKNMSESLIFCTVIVVFKVYLLYDMDERGLLMLKIESSIQRIFPEWFPGGIQRRAIRRRLGRRRGQAETAGSTRWFFPFVVGFTIAGYSLHLHTFLPEDMASGRSTNACCHRLSILQTMHVLRFRCTYYFRILYFGILPVVFGSHIFGIPLPKNWKPQTAMLPIASAEKAEDFNVPLRRSRRQVDPSKSLTLVEKSLWWTNLSLIHGNTRL